MAGGFANELLEVHVSGSSIPILGGFTKVELWAIGAGGPGRKGGGGGAGVAYKEYSILESEWGNTLTISIGASVAGSNGGNTTVNGTLGGSAITELKGFGGGRAGAGTGGGAGGTASGGTTNTTGEDGTEGDTETEVWGIGGKILDPTELNITTATTFGAGGGGAASGETVGYGGAIIAKWRS